MNYKSLVSDTSSMLKKALKTRAVLIAKVKELTKKEREQAKVVGAYGKEFIKFNKAYSPDEQADWRILINELLHADLDECDRHEKIEDELIEVQDRLCELETALEDTFYTAKNAKEV